MEQTSQDPSLFLIGKKRKSRPKRSYKHGRIRTFICLSSTVQESVPDGHERAELQIAGLGEKRVTLLTGGDASDFLFSLPSFPF